MRWQGMTKQCGRPRIMRKDAASVPLSLPKGASRPQRPESAMFSADSDDGIMTSFTREREVPGEVVLIRVFDICFDANRALYP